MKWQAAMFTEPKRDDFVYYLRSIKLHKGFIVARIKIVFFLCSFLTYCDYMTITILHEIIQKSFKLFADILIVHDVSGPSEYELLNTVINKKLELPRPSEYPQVQFGLCYQMIVIT